MLRNLCLAVVVGCFATFAVAAEGERMIVITGKVIDEFGHPVSHASVVVHDRSTAASQTVYTNRAGRYEAMHRPSMRCDLLVVPPIKSGLAQAYVQGVAADEGRHMVFSVHKGFEVTGRIVYRNKPVKGAVIKIIAADGDTVHGGGRAITDGKGEFEIVLTPGQKTCEIRVHHGEKVDVQSEIISVTHDTAIGDVSVDRSLARVPQ